MKSLGKIETGVTALNTLINNGTKGNLLLANALKTLSNEEKIAVVSRLALTEQQKLGILATSGLTKEELKTALSTATMDAANKKATLSTSSLKAAMAGLNATLAANPLFAVGILVASVLAGTKIIEGLTTSFEEQEEIVNNLSSEIDGLQQKYDALKEKDNRTEQENEYLSYLERELEVKKELYKEERRLLALKDLQGYNDPTSNGNLSEDIYSGTAMGGLNKNDVLSTSIKINLDDLEKARKEYSEGRQKYLDTFGKDKIKQYDDKFVKEESRIIENLNKQYTQAKEQWEAAFKDYDKIKGYLDEGIFEGDERTYWENELQKRQDDMDSLQSYINNLELTLGINIEFDLQEAKNTLEQKFGKNAISALSEEDIKIASTLDLGAIDNINQLIEAIKKAKKEADEPIEVKTDVKSTIEAVEKLSDGFDKIDSIYADVKDKGNFDYGSLIDKDFVDTFGDYKNEYNSFIETISKSPTNIEACQSAFNDLVSAWINGSGVLDNVTEENKSLITTMLEAQGVGNASVLVDSALAQSKMEAFIATHTLKEGTVEEIQALLDEAEAAGFTESSMYDLAVAVATADDSPLTFEQQINAIYDIADAAGLAKSALDSLITAAPADPSSIDLGSWSDAVKNGTLDEWTKRQQTKNQLQNVKDAFYEWRKQNKLTYTPPSANYTGGSKYSGSGGSGSKGSSSSKDPYVADIDKFKELSDAVDEVETKLKHLDQVYSHTDNINERIALKEAEIKLYKEEQDALTALNEARDKEISQKVKDLRAVGFQIEYDPKSDNLKIKNREYLNSLSQDMIQDKEKLIKATEELNDANKESAEKWRELTYSIVDTNKALTELRIDRYEKYITEQEHLIELLSDRKDTVGLDIPIYNDIMKTKLNEWKDLVKDGYEKNKEQIQDLENEWMDYYDKRLEREKEILEAQLNDNDKALDGVLNMLDEQSDAIQKQIDALKSANDERREALDLQKAQAALDKARNQRTRLVLRKGQGWVWEANQDEIQSAEQDLADKRFDATISSLEKQKEALDEIKEMWSEIPNIYDKEQAKLMASQLLGKNWEEQVLDGRIDIYEKFKDNYIGIQEDIADKTDELENHMNESYLRMVKIFEAFAKKFSTDLNPEATIISKYQLGEGNKAWYVNKDGKAPTGAKLGDIILTRGGTYKITGKDENGKFTSTKLDDRSSDIKDDKWGQVVADSTDKLADVLGLTTDTSKDIVDAAEKQTEQTKINILTENGLRTALSENSSLTDEEIDALIDSIDFTDKNTDSTDENTIAIDGLTDELKNFSLEKPIEEFPEDVFDDLDWDSMTTDEKNYINQLKDVYEAALRNGNDYMADKILSYLDDFKNGYGDEYIQIGKDVLAAATAPFGEVTKSTANSADRLSNLEKQLERAKNGGSSQSYIDSLERAIAIEKWGSGTEQYSSSNGYMTQTIISSKDEKEMYMTSDEIKQKYDYENGNKNNGYDPEKMAQTIADRIVESQNNPNSVWGSVVTNDLDKSLTDKVKADDKSSLGNSGSIKTPTVKLSDSDSDAIKAAQKAYNEAKAKGDTAGMEKAHDDAEAIRNKNGYSGGDDGSKVIAISNDKVTKELKNNSGSLSDNSDSNYYAGDSAKDAADKVSESAKTMADSVKDAAKSFLNSGGSSSGGKSSSIKSSGSSGSKGNSSSSSSVAQKVTSVIPVIKKKAKGGINLDPDIYNVDEIDEELLIHPDKGRYVVMEKGGSILPAEPTKRLWELGENPEAFIQSHMPQQAASDLSYNNQVVYNSRKETTQSNTYNYRFDNVEVEGVKDVMGFLDGLRSLPNRASQFMGVDRNRK